VVDKWGSAGEAIVTGGFPDFAIGIVSSDLRTARLFEINCNATAGQNLLVNPITVKIFSCSAELAGSNSSNTVIGLTLNLIRL